MFWFRSRANRSRSPSCLGKGNVRSLRHRPMQGCRYKCRRSIRNGFQSGVLSFVRFRSKRHRIASIRIRRLRIRHLALSFLLFAKPLVFTPHKCPSVVLWHDFNWRHTNLVFELCFRRHYAVVIDGGGQYIIRISGKFLRSLFRINATQSV